MFKSNYDFKGYIVKLNKTSRRSKKFLMISCLLMLVGTMVRAEKSVFVINVLMELCRINIMFFLFALIGIL